MSSFARIAARQHADAELSLLSHGNRTLLRHHWRCYASPMTMGRLLPSADRSTSAHIQGDSEPVYSHVGRLGSLGPAVRHLQVGIHTYRRRPGLYGKFAKRLIQP